MDESKQILIALSRLEENVKNMNNKIDGFSKVSEMALETNQSVKSAHIRIDDLKTEMAKQLLEMKAENEKDINAIKTEHAKDIVTLKTDSDSKALSEKVVVEEKIKVQSDNLKELKGDIKWIWRTIATGAIGFIFGLILYLIKFFGG